MHLIRFSRRLSAGVPAHRRALAAAALLWGACSAAAAAEACEGGAFQNPQFFRGESAHHAGLADQELHAFIGRTGLPVTPMYTVKRVDEVTASTKRPFCWIYANSVMGLLSGYKPVVVNREAVQPALLAVTTAKATKPGAAPLSSFGPAEQQEILSRLTRSKCFGTTGGVEAAIIRTEALCGQMQDVPPQAAIGQVGLIAKAAFEWDEATWIGAATRLASAGTASLSGLAGRTPGVQGAQLVVIPTKTTSFGFGLYVHASVPEATVKKAAAVFEGLVSPSKPLAVALDLGPGYAFVAPTAEMLRSTTAAVGITR